MGKRGHETIDHTADMGIRGWGESPLEALEEIALAMFELIAEREDIATSREIDIACEGNDLRELLVEFLNQFLLKADLEEMVFADVKIDRLSETEGAWALDARARGAPKSEAVDKLLREVKAATYYGALVENDGSGNWEAQCVVDL